MDGNRMQMKDVVREKSAQEREIERPGTASPLRGEECPYLTLDIRQDQCPITYVKTRLTLEAMESGQTLELLIKGAEPLRNVPRSIRGDGHKILSVKKEADHFRLIIRKA